MLTARRRVTEEYILSRRLGERDSNERSHLSATTRGGLRTACRCFSGLHFTTISYPNRFYIAQLDGSAPSEVLADFLAQNKLSADAAVWYPDGKRITVWVSEILRQAPAFGWCRLLGGQESSWKLLLRSRENSTEASTQGDPGQQLGDYSFSWSPSGAMSFTSSGPTEGRETFGR